ncbi:MAG: PilZ domain-containing protein [Deltaproteobacteria bacterium]|nr:MAG: PilZ domain-containing protein [Deltaproteobacteria bacterium]
MPDRRKGTDRRKGPRRGVERRMGDRRESHRVPLEVEVSKGNGPFEKHHGDIGIGGIFFAKPLPLPPGAQVKIRFTLPGEPTRQVLGEVVEITKVGRPEEQGTRIKFVELDVKTELAIARFLDDNPP